MKIYVRAPLSDTVLKKLEEQFTVKYDPWSITGQRYYEDELLSHLQEEDCDILVTELDRVTEKVLSQYTKLKCIIDCRATPANIDVLACSRHQVPLICTPARNAVAVAEMVVGLVIMSERNILPSIQWIKDNQWKEGTTPYHIWMGHELYGQKVGIVGLGAVGREVAKRLHAFGCEIQYYDPFVHHEAYTKVSLEQLFKSSDLISIHLPVSPETKQLISHDLLYSMKPTATLINTARSAVVDYEALGHLAREKRINKIILDVLENEPPKKEDLVISQYDNVILTPHICGATYEITNHQADILYTRLEKFLNRQDLNQIIYNFKDINL